MPRKPRNELGPIGALVLADTTLGEVLGEMLREVRRVAGVADPDTIPDTTGTRAKHLRGCLKPAKRATYPGLSDIAGLRDWVASADEASERRNDLVHAAAADQCSTCGEASTFVRGSRPVDRSKEAATACTEELRSLIQEGLRLAPAVTAWINARYLEGDEQNPRQVKLQAVTHTCAECNGGTRQVTIEAPTLIGRRLEVTLSDAVGVGSELGPHQAQRAD